MLTLVLNSTIVQLELFALKMTTWQKSGKLNFQINDPLLKGILNSLNYPSDKLWGLNPVLMCF